VSDLACDVAIVGCGPVGAVASNLLGLHGLRVTVIERAAEIYDKPRAITGDHEMLRVLQHCGFGAQLDAMVAPHPGSLYLGVDGQPIKRLDPLPPPFPLGWLPTATFVQPDLEVMLRDGLARFASVSLLTGWEAVTLTQDVDMVRLTIRQTGGGATQQVTARFALACDGANSALRKALGLTLEDLAFDEWWMVVDTWQRQPVELPETCVQYCWPERPATFIRGPGDLRRWEIKLLPGEDPTAFGTDDNVRRQIARFADPDALELWRSAVYRFHALVARRWQAGRAFLLGDAAHQTPPFMGQGLCAGIRDAANLAWKLAAVLQGRAAPALLDSYEAERKPHFRTVVERTKELGQIIGELDRDAAARRDADLRSALTSGRAQTIRQRFIPDLLDGVIARDAAGVPCPAAGTLFVQPRVRTAEGDRRLDDALPPGFLFVTTALGAQDWLDGAALALWRHLGGTRVVIGDATQVPGVLAFGETGTLLRDWMACHGAEAAIVRPDRVVYAVAASATQLVRHVTALGAALGATPAGTYEESTA
jgi:3-(3-hydroxy-phenyl)propionate hydroxylase